MDSYKTKQKKEKDCTLSLFLYFAQRVARMFLYLLSKQIVEYRGERLLD